MKKLTSTYLSIFIALALIAGIEYFARNSLFKFVTYYNYDAIDLQMSDFKNAQNINTLFIGSSEVRYGFNPEIFDASTNHLTSSFNLGIDGMNLSYYRLLLPFLNPKKTQPHIQYAVIGLNLTEDVRLYPDHTEGGIDCDTDAGVLQKGVFTSDFAIDTDLIKVCKSTSSIINHFSASAQSLLYSFKHKKALRSFMLHPWKHRYSHEELNQTELGFHKRPHAPSQEELDKEFAQWWNNEGHASVKIKNTDMKESLASKGLYPWFAHFFRSHHIEPIFVSLPTNPRMIKMLGRSEDYHQRSALFAQWAKSQNILYVDLGLKENYDPVKDFADRRHLSQFGAAKFSQELGETVKDILKKSVHE